MACFAARLVPINAHGFHEDARNTSTTRSSMSLTTMVYCLGVLSPGPRTVTLGGGPDHCAPIAHSRRQDTVRPGYGPDKELPRIYPTAKLPCRVVSGPGRESPIYIPATTL